MTPRKPSNPSPLTENPDSSRTPKPNSRSSEIGDPMRRRFNGNLFQKPSIVANPRGFNPVTPANSPSDWSVRGRESNTMRFLRETDEKENARDSNHQNRPAAKGMKNFMSPTVSAASKINASPCKKVLTERISHQQTPLRRSVSSVDLGSWCSSETMEESEAGFGKELDLREPLFPSALSPYDPKTNFLAPRPKFLYYKPKEMDCNPIDCETEETESDISHESKDVVSSQAAAAKEDVVDTGIEKERSRQLLFTKSKCILSAFILLLVACSTMMETDHFQSTRSYNSMIKESSFRSFGVLYWWIDV